jgi:hypothetical protein
VNGIEILQRIFDELARREEFYQRGCSPNIDDDDTFAQGYSKCFNDLLGLFPVFLTRDWRRK